MRVYERRKDGPLHVEYTGAERQTLANLEDVPITDKDLAVKIANRLSERLAEGAKRQAARAVLGLAESRTLEELTHRYHKDLTESWSASHRRHQEALRDWWKARLGPGTIIYQVTEADVEREVRKGAKARDWSPRTEQKYLRYIMALFRYAHRKLRWIKEEHSLSGIEVPTPSRGGPSYSREELVRRMLPAAPGVDTRVSAALEVAYDTQARSKAILHLQVDDLDGFELTFRALHDKAGKQRVAVLSPSARRALERLIEERQPTRWLFEEDGKRMSYDHLLALLREVEEAAGVPYVKGRGWHAVKRRAVTDARQAVGDMGAVSKQSGTLTSTLERVYEQDDMAPKQAVASAMEGLRRASESPNLNVRSVGQ